VLRIHFTADDLARTRVEPTLGPLAETLLAARLLHHDHRRDLFGGWRQHVRRQLPSRTGLLRPLFGPTALLDLFTLTGRSGCLDEGLDALLAVPRAQLCREVGVLASRQTLPPAARALGDGDNDSLLRLATAVRDLHEVAVGRAWTRVHAYLDAANAEQQRLLATGGVERLLASVHPRAHWRPPVLEVATTAAHCDDYLRGRGLVLVPSLFCWPAPIALHSLADDTAPYLLLVPAVRDLADLAAAWTSGERHARALVALLGRTRAAVLGAVGDGCTTTELARRAGVSLPSASQHAQILRDSGLLVTRRAGKSVHHQLTSLGAALLNSTSLDPPPSHRAEHGTRTS
jgi:DNA-binding transcriptional ArsR family regulator